MNDPLGPIDPPWPVWSDPTAGTPLPGADGPTRADADPRATEPGAARPDAVPPAGFRTGGRSPTRRPDRPAARSRPRPPARRRRVPARPSVSPVVVTVAVVAGVLLLLSLCSTGVQSLL